MTSYIFVFKHSIVNRCLTLQVIVKFKALESIGAPWSGDGVNSNGKHKLLVLVERSASERERAVHNLLLKWQNNPRKLLERARSAYCA